MSSFPRSAASAILGRMHARSLTPIRAALVAALALSIGTTPPLAAQDGAAQDGATQDDATAELSPDRMKALKALCDEFAAAAESKFPDGAMLLVENRVETEAAIPASSVAPLLEYMLKMRKKIGPKLKKKGQGYFYDKDSKKGRYIVSKGKKGGGLLLSLHGGGEGQGDAGGAHGTWGSATSSGFTVISPEVMTKVSSAWNEEPEEQMVLELIDAAKRTFDIDPLRICIAGHSMGGDASWMLGGRNADMWAAAAPLAGSVMPYMRAGTRNKRLTPLSDYEGLMEGVIPNLMHVPYHIHHSDDDENEAVHPDDIATGYLKRLQTLFPGHYAFDYDRVTGIKHALPSDGVRPIIKWMAKQRRVTFPDEVVWETWWPWKTRSYWLFHKDPKSAWRFHAKLVGANHFDVTATSKMAPGRKEPKEFELRILLSPEMVNLAQPIKVTSGDAVLFEGRVRRSLWALMVTAGRRMDPTDAYEAYVNVKVPRLMWSDLWDGER